MSTTVRVRIQIGEPGKTPLLDVVRDVAAEHAIEEAGERTRVETIFSQEGGAIVRRPLAAGISAILTFTVAVPPLQR